MRTVNPNKCLLKWNKSRFGELSHTFTLNDKTTIASIFPKETKDGKLQWGFWIDRKCGEELNTDSPKSLLEQHSLTPTFSKRKDAKRKIEDAVKSMMKGIHGNTI